MDEPNGPPPPLVPDSPVRSEPDREHKALPLELPVHYDGLVFKAQTAYDKDGVTVSCPYGHHGCSKWRGLGQRQTAAFGPWETIAFLLVWARHGENCDTRQAHRDFPVRHTEVEAAFHELVGQSNVDSD